MIVGTAISTILVETIVPIMLLGTKISLTAVTTINVGRTVWWLFQQLFLEHLFLQMLLEQQFISILKEWSI